MEGFIPPSPTAAKRSTCQFPANRDQAGSLTFASPLPPARRTEKRFTDSVHGPPPPNDLVFEGCDATPRHDFCRVTLGNFSSSPTSVSVSPSRPPRSRLLDLKGFPPRVYQSNFQP